MNGSVTASRLGVPVNHFVFREEKTLACRAFTSAVAREGASGMVRARVVAYRRGDTTLVRPFSAVQPPGAANLGALTIGFCGEMIRAAKAATSQPPKEEPDDSLPLWRQRPMH